MIEQSRWRHALALFAALLLAGSMVGCGQSVEGVNNGQASNNGAQTGNGYDRQPAELNETVFIGIDEFEQLRADGATVLDVRGQEEYDQGHVPGAVLATWDVFKDAERDGAYAEDDADVVEQKARSIGISNDTPVLVYAQAVSTLATRQAWALEYYGHGEVYILDGGFEVWSADSNLDPSTDTPTVEPGDFEVGFRPSVIATGEDVRAAVDGTKTAILFDARSAEEYEGTDERDNPRHGHIPDAIHYEWTNVFDADGKLRPKGELRTELQDAGLLVDDAVIIPYCQGGFRSSVIYSVLRWLGHESAQNYDGSWYEWARTEGYPVE